MSQVDSVPPAASPTGDIRGIHRIDTTLGERVSSLYLIVGSRAAVLFDTGVDGTIPDAILPALDVLGVDPAIIRWAVVSHADVDHFGGVADVHECLPGAHVLVGGADANLVTDYRRFEAERVRGFRHPWGVDESPEGIAWCRSVTRTGRVDQRVVGGETLDLGDRIVEIVAVPGHSLGHLALKDHTTGAWLISDAVLGAAVPFADGRPAFPPTYRYLSEYRATIGVLQRAGPTALYTAHYGTYTGPAVAEFLSSSLTFTQTLNGVLGELLANGPTTLGALLLELNQRIATWPLEGTAGALAFPTVAHLEQWAARGRITISPAAGGATISLNPSSS